jgi:hypothetical protein
MALKDLLEDYSISIDDDDIGVYLVLAFDE